MLERVIRTFDWALYVSIYKYCHRRICDKVFSLHLNKAIHVDRAKIHLQWAAVQELCSHSERLLDRLLPLNLKKRWQNE